MSLGLLSGLVLEVMKGDIMKKTDIIVLALIVIAIGLFSSVSIKIRAEPVDTYQQGWQLVRETATEDAADFATVYDLAGAEGDFASKDSASVLLGGPFRLKSQRSDLGQRHSFGDRWQFIICGGLVAADTFSFDIVGWAADNGPLQVLGIGDGVLGSQDVVLYPDDTAAATNIFWADELNLDATTKWTKAEGGANGISAFNDSAADDIAVIQLYPQGLEWIQFIFYDADDSQGGEADPMTVYGRRI